MPSDELDGDVVPTVYANVYLANGGVIVPIGESPTDENAIAILEKTFPDREVVGVSGAALSYGGGGPHCVTMQIPAAQYAS